MNDFTEQFKKEAGKHKSGKSMADVVGLPDEEDKQRIRRYLERYEKQHPGEIAFCIGAARAHFRQAGGDKQKFGVVNRQAQGRTLFELPVELGRWLEQAYPLMFKAKEHTGWFARNFPELLIPEKF